MKALRPITFWVCLLVVCASFANRAAADYSVSSIVQADLNYNNTYWGSSFSETNVSPASAAYQVGTTVYGGNDPILYTGLMMIESGAVQSGAGMNTMKITVTVTDSSGNQLSSIRIGDQGMLTSPQNSGVDWSGIFATLVDYVSGLAKLPSPSLLLKYGATYSGTCAQNNSCDSSDVWALWNFCGGICPPSSVPQEGVNFRYQVDFPQPDVYTIAVSTYAILAAGPTTQRISVGPVTSNYSFAYVYENDARSGNDAGKDFSSATPISMNSYSGFGYGADTVDMYKFDGYAGQTVYYNLVSPISADFGAALYDPSWNPISGSGGDPGTGNTLYGSFTPSSTGTYYERIYLTSGSGAYSFALSTSPIPPDFSISTSPSYYCLYPGTQAGFSTTLHSINGFSSSVTLVETISPPESWLWGGFTQPPGNPITISVPAGGMTTAHFYVQSSADIYNDYGDFTVTVTATSGSLQHVASSALHVDAFGGCQPPGGGSVASGTLITLADHSQVPVQNLGVGDQLLSYNMTSHQYATITLTRFVTVETDNLMVIHTATGKPLITDQNPAQKLEVSFPNGTSTELSVTELRVGYCLFDASTRTWVPVTMLQYVNGGVHAMYDIYTDAPTLNYIANNYLDYIKQ